MTSLKDCSTRFNSNLLFTLVFHQVIIQPTGGGDNYLPVAHTCFNVLDLPKYTNKDTLRRKLVQAIQQSEGFGLV